MAQRKTSSTVSAKAKDAKVAKTSSKVAKVSVKVAKASTKVTKASTKVTKASTKVTKASTKVVKTSAKVAKPAAKVVKAPGKVVKAPTKVAAKKAPAPVTAPTKIANASVVKAKTTSTKTAPKAAKAKVAKQSAVGEWVFDRIESQKTPLTDAHVVCVIIEATGQASRWVRNAAMEACQIDVGPVEKSGNEVTVRWKSKHAGEYTLTAQGALRSIERDSEHGGTFAVLARRVTAGSFAKESTALHAAWSKRAQASSSALKMGSVEATAPPFIENPGPADLEGESLFIVDGRRYVLESAEAQPWRNAEWNVPGWTLLFRHNKLKNPTDAWLGVNLQITQAKRLEAGDIFARAASDLNEKRRPKSKQPVLTGIAWGLHPTSGSNTAFGAGPVDSLSAYVMVERAEILPYANKNGPGGSLRLRVFVNARRTMAPLHELVLRASVEVPVQYVTPPMW